jgi:transposase
MVTRESRDGSRAWCACPLKAKCTTGKERRIKRREHEGGLETMQRRLDHAPGKIAVRRQTVARR